MEHPPMGWTPPDLPSGPGIDDEEAPWGEGQPHIGGRRSTLRILGSLLSPNAPQNILPALFHVKRGSGLPVRMAIARRGHQSLQVFGVSGRCRPGGVSF